jgi:hypothetical protein
LQRALADSPFKEHKLSVRRFFAGAGTRVVDRAARRTSLSSAQFRSLVDSTVDLELYMPVKEHRASWNGSAGVLVAYQLTEGDPLRAYDPAGQVRELSLEAPPATPTLVLVESETNFEHAPVREGYMIADCETYPELCAGEGGGGGGGGGSTPPTSLLYAKNFHLDDLHEPWNRGDPELEIHVTGLKADSTVGTISCSSKDGNLVWAPFDMRKAWNMDGHYYSDSVLVATPSDLVAGGDSSKTIELWEDDNEACTTHDNSDWWTKQKAFVLSGVLVPTSILVRGECQTLVCEILELGSYVFGPAAVEYWVSGRFFSVLFGMGDDQVGTLVLASQWNADHGDNVTTTHAVVLDGQRVGTVDLFIVPPTP